MILAIRVLLCVLGATLLSLGLFIYEDEEKRIQSRLEDWWIHLDDKQIHVLGRERAFLLRLSMIASKLLDSLFGQKLISCQAVVVSAWASVIATILMIPAVFANVSPSYYVGYLLIALWAVINIWIVRRFRWVGFALWVVSFFRLSFVVFQAGRTVSDRYGALTGFEFVLLVSTATDLVVIAIIRKALRSASNTSSTAKALWRWFGVFFLALVCFAGLPYLAFIDSDESSPASAFSVIWFFGLFFFNSADVVFLIATAFLGGLLLLHHAAWPTLSRLLYAFQRASPIGNKKVTCSIGLAMLSTGLALKQTWMTPVFEAVKKALGG